MSDRFLKEQYLDIDHKGNVELINKLNDDDILQENKQEKLDNTNNGMTKGKTMRHVAQIPSFPRAFFCIEADRDSLYCSDIIYGTFLFKICQRDMPGGFIHFNRSDRRRDFLDEGQSLFPVLLIGTIDKFLQSGASKPSAVPRCHKIKPFFNSKA